MDHHHHHRRLGDDLLYHRPGILLNTMRWSIKHHNFCPHHRYQLEVVFLFVFGFFLFIPYYLAMEKFGLEMPVWQWYFFWPWMIFYVLYLLNLRRQIRPGERVSPLKRPIGHWALLGLALIALHLQPTDLIKLQTVDLMFAIFSLFLADSYWDFKKAPIFKTRERLN